MDTGTSTVCGAYLLIYVDYWGRGAVGEESVHSSSRWPYKKSKYVLLNLNEWSVILLIVIFWNFFPKKIIFSAIFGPINKFLVVMSEKKLMYALDNFSRLCFSTVFVYIFLSRTLPPTQTDLLALRRRKVRVQESWEVHCSMKLLYYETKSENEHKSKKQK